MTYHDPIDTSFAIIITLFALLLVAIIVAAIMRAVDRSARAEGIEIGIAIGERNELRRRDDMNVRARVIAELQMQRDAEEERNKWEIDA